MATVVRRKPGDTDDKLIAQFRKKVQLDKILPELKEREYYRSPAEIKKERLKALRRNRFRRYY